MAVPADLEERIDNWNDKKAIESRKKARKGICRHKVDSKERKHRPRINQLKAIQALRHNCSAQKEINRLSGQIAIASKELSAANREYALAKEARQESGKELARALGLPTKYLDDIQIFVRDSKVDVFFGGKVRQHTSEAPSKREGHGHYVVEDCVPIYKRDPFQERGPHNHLTDRVYCPQRHKRSRAQVIR